MKLKINSNSSIILSLGKFTRLWWRDQQEHTPRQISQPHAVNCKKCMGAYANVWAICSPSSSTPLHCSTSSFSSLSQQINDYLHFVDASVPRKNTRNQQNSSVGKPKGFCFFSKYIEWLVEECTRRKSYMLLLSLQNTFSPFPCQHDCKLLH